MAFLVSLKSLNVTQVGICLLLNFVIQKTFLALRYGP